VFTPTLILKFKVVVGMSPFQPIVDKLAGIEQFLLGRKIYLAAGIFRQLHEDIVREGFADPPRPAPVEDWSEVWKTIESLRPELWKILSERRELDEERKVELYNRWLRLLAAAYYQLRLSVEAAPVLENYLIFRALTMLGGRPAHTEEVLWQWWLKLRELAKILTDIHSDTNFLFENYRQEMPRPEPEEEEDYWAEPEFSEEEFYSMAELALDWIIGSDAPFDYERFGTLSVYAFRDLREWARYGGDFYRRLAEEITREARKLVRRLIDELLGQHYVVINFTTSSPYPFADEEVIEEVTSMITPRHGVEGVGLRAGIARVNFFNSDEQSTFTTYVFLLEPTSEIGQRIVSKVKEREPEWHTVGNRLVRFVFSEADLGIEAATLQNATEEAFWEIAKERLVDTDNEWVRLEFLRQLEQTGLLENMDMISAVVRWVEGLSGDPKTQIRAWEAVNSFLRGYYEQQKRGPVHGDVVLEEIKRWLEFASEMLYKYGHLDSLPENERERQQFLDDVRKFISRTEEMLSSLHGSGGMLTKLTRSGTYSDLFRLVGLREGVLLPEAARRYWLHEGDKKLLLKWLFLHKVVGWSERNA
jgi:hypothetical protein